MIGTARDRWFDSDDCTVRTLVDYILRTGQMRDAQVEAIRTYLFLKIGCANQPLASLFSSGAFNNLDLDQVETSSTVRTFLEKNTAAAALYEYAGLKNESGEQVSAKVEQQIRRSPECIDYDKFFQDAFYGISYTDYLFSLPMGAGKTYLMAAFIYFDLYFALNEPQNPAFAHNFIIFAPSGLKSSVVPSLRTIQNFNPAWVLPEPTAGDIKRKLIFEVLDQGRTATKSNRTKNPNVQKIANHQPLSELFGLVAVTNAEKVILDRIKETNGEISFLEESNDDKDRQANELRNLIGKLPSLSIFIDEVHHAVSDEIKLRAVVNKWSENQTINSVIGFSGTPYLERAEKREVNDKLSVASSEISNVVYYYPLINGVGNFLKKPTVKISDVKDSARIIEAGVREFLGKYQDTVYEGGLIAKLGIYCGTIEKLEQTVYPLVSRILTEYGIAPGSILKFHKGNKEYPQPADSQLQFDILDSPLSHIRIVLLVQIGKEGWDCRSLTGIVLSQEGVCPKNMVLQTSCRCLRQVVRNASETALIYLNDSNADKLNAQLEQQHRISLKEFSEADNQRTELCRYDRTEYLKLPPVQYYQLKINYETQTVETAKPSYLIPTAVKDTEIFHTVKTQDFERNITDIAVDATERGDKHITFTAWMYGIGKSSFGFLTMLELGAQKTVLRSVFNTITYEQNGSRYLSSRFDHGLIEANIRKSFYNKRGFITSEELIPEEARLLNIANFTESIHTDIPKNYYPDQKTVHKIIADDSGELKANLETQTTIQALRDAGQEEMAQALIEAVSPYPSKDRSFHYLPYKTDSAFEQIFLKEVLALDDMKTLRLEVYYNGDQALTEFKICCYKSIGDRWRYIGMYTPDFLIIRRKDGAIQQAVIVETKGRIYANDPTFIDKRNFMPMFIHQNNSAFGYERFEYLYLEDSLSEIERIMQTHQAIRRFFKEEVVNG